MDAFTQTLQGRKWGSMSKYREPSESHDVSFEELEVIEKLLESKKLTDRQKEAVKSLLKYYYSMD